MSGLLDEIIFLQAAVEVLDDFILSSGHSWPLAVKHPKQLPPLTPGNLLLCQMRLAGKNQADPNQVGSARLLDVVEHHFIRWNASWERKSRKEYPERLRLWLNYLNDLAGDMPGNRGSYSYNVRWRVILQLLDDEFGAASGQTGDPLLAADLQLKKLFQPGKFIWEPEVQNSFPIEKFWFLYMMV